MNRYILFLFVVLCTVHISECTKGKSENKKDRTLSSPFHWSVGSPLIYPPESQSDYYYSIKDPSVVYYNNRWHLFCSIRGKNRSHQIEYLSFKDWHNVGNAERHILKISDGYFCAPQIFYFSPQKKWYLIHQAIDQDREKPKLQPTYSTTADISDPDSWSKPAFLFKENPDNITMWIDFWIICDESRAHLFFTSLNGLMWRSETTRETFPLGWSRPEIVLEADVFEASHTYRLKGLDKYLTVIEAEDKGKRHFKAYTADSLDGEWQPLAATKEQPFASPENVKFRNEVWTGSFSHGELIRDGYDELLEVDPVNMRLLFQGVADEARKGIPYGQIPWRLGILESAKD